MSADGVPPVLRPVLEALAQASDHRDWMSRAAEIDAAYQQLSDVCRAALASDAGTPEGAGTPYSIAMAEGTAVEQADERQLLEALGKAAAPDAELERLLIEYARCQVQARYASLPQPEINRLAYAVEDAAAAIRAHVERVKREAHDIGFRRGLRELPPDLRRPPEDDELPRAVDMMAAMEAPDAHP